MSDKPHFTMEAFAEHAKRITQEFEKRRVQFLHKLKFRALLACILLFTFPFWYSLLTRWDYLDNGLSTVGVLIVNVLAAVIIIISIIAYAVHPLFRYRYDTLKIGGTLPGSTGVVNQPVTLKEQLFTELFKYFGDFRIYSDRKLSLRSFKGAPNIPEFDAYECSDYMKGQYDGVTIEMAEVALNVQREASIVAAFHGLFVILDINDPNVVLRGKFSGKTVLIHKKNAGNEFVAEKYDGYKLVNFSDTSFTQQLEGLSTVSEEANRLFSADFLRSFLKFSDAVVNNKNQTRSIDDKIAFALERIAGGLGDVLAAVASAILNWFKTGSFNTVSSRHKIHTPQTTITDSSKAFGSQPQCSFYEDKVLISIPTTCNLFEPDSVFQKPLTQEDVTLAYGLMTELTNMVKSTVSAITAEQP